MDLDALRSFLAFVDTGSFTRAAKQTYRSQSAISMQMLPAVDIVLAVAPVPHPAFGAHLAAKISQDFHQMSQSSESEGGVFT